MKRTVFFSVLISSVLLAASTAAAGEIKVTFDGEEMSFTNPPKIINDRVMIPVRAVFEKLGAKVTWDGEKKRATAIRDARYVQLSEGNDYMYFGVCLGGTDDGELNYTTSEKLDSVPVINGGTMFVPARAAAEAFDYEVNWNADKNTVEITTPSEADGWIYYSSWNDGGHMYKIDTNGQHRQKLTDDDCYSEDWNYSYIDDYIYYSKRSEEGILYRIKNDGTNEQQLTERPAKVVYDYQSENRRENRYKEVYFIEAAEDYELRDTVMGTSSFNFYGYLKCIDTETGETVQLVEDPIAGATMYGDYIYFKYYGETLDKAYTYYRIDKDGSNLINVTGNIPVNYIRFDSKNDKIGFSGKGKSYTADLDGSNVEVTENSYSYFPYDSIRKKYEFVDMRTIYSKDGDIYIGRKADDNHIYGVDKEENELFAVLLPEEVESLYDLNFKISGEEIFYTISVGEWEASKIYAETIDELAGMEYISVSSEKVDGKYEITDEYGYNDTYIPAEWDGVYRIGADGSSSIIVKGYRLVDIKDDKLILIDMNKVRYENYENIMLYQSDFDGNNMKEYMSMGDYETDRFATVSADNKKGVVRVKENAHYGIIVRNDGTVSSYNGEIYNGY